MWDLTVISVIINPELAQKTEVSTPSENTQRKVFVYTQINPEEIEADFWESML
ncbi:hypothetical protein BH23BAC1_BH23BAC1_38430 [soil metagenome]